jgi:hypothetical protein
VDSSAILSCAHLCNHRYRAAGYRRAVGCEVRAGLPVPAGRTLQLCAGHLREPHVPELARSKPRERVWPGPDGTPAVPGCQPWFPDRAAWHAIPVAHQQDADAPSHDDARYADALSVPGYAGYAVSGARDSDARTDCDSGSDGNAFAHCDADPDRCADAIAKAVETSKTFYFYLSAQYLCRLSSRLNGATAGCSVAGPVVADSLCRYYVR